MGNKKQRVKNKVPFKKYPQGIADNQYFVT